MTRHRTMHRRPLAVIAGLLATLFCQGAVADAAGVWLVDETGVKFDTTLSKIPLLGKILGRDAARQQVAWLINRDGDRYTVRIPEREVNIAVPADEQRLVGGTETARVDITVDGERLRGTLTLNVVDNQANKNSVDDKPRQLVYEVDGTLAAVTVRTRASVDALRREVAALNAALVEEKRLRAASESSAERLRRDADSADSKLAAISANLDTRQQAMNDLRDQLAAAKARAADLEQRNQVLQAQTASDRAGREAAQSSLESQLADVSRQRDAARREAAAASEALEALRVEAGTAAGRAMTERTALESSIDSLGRENADLRSRVEALEAELEGLRQAAGSGS